MAISPYVASLRARVGASRLLLPSVTAIIYGERGEILLVRQRDGGVWSTPGGAIEPDETQYVMCVFECIRISGELASSTEEVTQCRFVAEADFDKLPVSPWTRHVLPLCYARPEKPIIGIVTWTPQHHV